MEVMGRNRRVTGMIFSITPKVEKLGSFRTVQCGSTLAGVSKTTPSFRKWATWNFEVS